MKKTKETGRNKGITLIALVITIIVLLILAGISVATLTGNNGIITNAKTAKINTAEAEKEEIEKLNQMEETMHENIPGELFLQYNIEYSESKDYAKIIITPRIGGIPKLQTYEEYINPEKALEGKSYGEKKEMVISYIKDEMLKDYFEEVYPGQEVTEEMVLSAMGVSSMDELCQSSGVENIDELIIMAQIVGHSEYQEYYTNYQETYNEEITIIDPAGKSNVVKVGREYSYTVISNGTYNFVAQYNSQEINKDIQVNGIVVAKEMEIAKENENTYVISKIEDLVKLSINVNNGYEYQGKTFKLINNLDFNDASSYTNANDKKTFGDYNGDGIVEGIKDELLKDNVGGIKQIGETRYINFTDFKYSFKGTLEGNNKTISNLLVNSKKTFFNKNEGNIQNITVMGSNSPLCNENYGLISGYSNSSDMQIDGDAGVVILNYGSIKNTVNKAHVVTSGTYCLGGIATHNYEGTIENCINEGLLEGNERVGGMAGENTGNIIKCANIAEINAKREVGGICGWNYLTIEECYNTGKIVGVQYHVGGIAGRNQYGEILVKNCYNTGEVSAPNASYVGGIIGSINRQNGIISNCYNTGNVSGKKGSTGAIAGAVTTSSILNCVYSKENYSNICDAQNQVVAIKNNKEDTLENLKGSSMMETLKTDNEGEIWVEVDNEYPILKWQGE